MDIETTRWILSDLTRHNSRPIDELWVTGGEPLFHSHFKEMLSLFRSFGYESILVSNGCYNAPYIRKLVDAKENIRRVHLSLEGMRTSNDCIRGEGVYDTVVGQTIPALKSAGIHVCVTVHLRKANKDEIRPLADLLIDQLGCDLKFGILRPIGRAARTLIPQMLSPEELYECIKVIYEIKRRYNTKRIWHDWDILSEDVKFYIQDFHGRYACPAGLQSIIAFTPEYDVYPCVQLRSGVFRLGNWGDTGGLEALVNLPASRRVYELLRARPEQCERCRFFKVSCHGGCPAVPYGLRPEEKSSSAMDPYCFAHCLRDPAVLR